MSCLPDGKELSKCLWKTNFGLFSTEEKEASEKQFVLKGLTPLIANPKV